MTMPDNSRPLGGTGQVRLRPYQERAVADLRELVRQGARRVLVAAATGSGKCVTPETLVWSRGLKRLGEVWGEDRIATPYGVGQINGWHDDGRRLGFEVELDCGLIIDATPAHRLWVRNMNGYEGWRRVADLLPHDYIGIARGQADFGEQQIPLEEAYALGLLIADGCFTGGTLKIDKQRPVVERIRPIVEQWYGVVGTGARKSRIVDYNENHAAIFSCGNFPPFFKDRYGIDWTYSEYREVPRCVREGTREVVQAFLRGYFDGDGYCDRKPGISTASPRLADQVAQLLLGLGVFSKRRFKRTPCLPAFIVEIYDIEAFAREVGFTSYGLTKDRSLSRLLRLKRNTNVDIVPGVGPLLQSASRLIPSPKRQKSTWRHLWAYGTGKRRPSYEKLDEFIAPLPLCPERTELERISRERRAWSRVRRIEESDRRRIDCEVEEHHAFIGNGLINHNTTVAGHLIHRAASTGHWSLFIAHRRELINQAYGRLLQMGLPEDEVGVIMARDPRRRPGARVQVASIDTLRNRPKPRADIVFTDECHRILARSHRDVAAHYPDAIHIGLTATPYRADGRGLGEMYDELVQVSSPLELIQQGYLVEPRVFTVPQESLPDLSGIRVRRGDYSETELAEAVDRQSIVGNIVEHWHRHAQGLRTVAFAVSVRHSQHIAEQFRQAGVPAEHLDGTTPLEARDAILHRVDTGETLVVSNCLCLQEGWDQPSVKCAILARPTKSTGLYLQQAGRILRPWGGLGAVILDHAGCALEHGLPQDDRELTLDSAKKRTTGPGTGPPLKTCEECYAVVHAATRLCPECGFVFQPPREVPQETGGDLVEVSADGLREKRVAWEKLCAVAATRGFKPGWAYHRYREQFGASPPASFETNVRTLRQTGVNVTKALRDAVHCSAGQVSWETLAAIGDQK